MEFFEREIDQVCRWIPLHLFALNATLQTFFQALKASVKGVACLLTA